MYQANATERFDKNPRQKIQIDSWDEVDALELNEPLKLLNGMSGINTITTNTNALTENYFDQ